jgi:hypothetical protein
MTTPLRVLNLGVWESLFLLALVKKMYIGIGIAGLILAFFIFCEFGDYIPPIRRWLDRNDKSDRPNRE